MKLENLRSLIRESVHDYIREIDEAAKVGAIKASIAKCEEAIGIRERKMNMEGLDEAYHDMLDKGKMAELKSEIKALTKSLEKYKKQLAKLEKVDEVKDDVVTDSEVEEVATDETMTEEAPIDETDVMAEMDVEETAINESFLKMQKLAGVITESQYNQKKRLIENQLEETSLSPNEQKILDYILGENIEEGATDIINRLKTIIAKGALTATIAASLLQAAPAEAKPTITNVIKTELPSMDLSKLGAGSTEATKDPIPTLKASLSKTGFKMTQFPGGSALNWGANANKTSGATCGLSISYEQGKPNIDINITHVDGKSKSGYDALVAAAKKLGGNVQTGANGNLTMVKVPKEKINDVISFVNSNVSSFTK